MKNTVAIVDYGMGNLRSVWQHVQAAAADSSVQVQVTHDPAVVHAASRVVLPGQGAMRDCMAALRHSGLKKPCARLRPANRCLACAWVCNCCQSTAKRATPSRWDPILDRCAALTWPASAKPTAAASSAANGLEPSLADRARRPAPPAVGAGVADGSFFTLSTATTPSPHGPTMAQQQQITA